MVNTLASYHLITQGTITVGCNNISALELSFEIERPITTKHPDHDILYEIRAQLSKSPISWTAQHVQGHQNDQRTLTVLSQLKTLNCEMDNLAKTTLMQIEKPPEINNWGSCWSIWIDSKRVVKKFSATIYDHLHRNQALNYWCNNGKITADTAKIMDWEMIHRAMSSIPLPQSTCQECVEWENFFRYGKNGTPQNAQDVYLMKTQLMYGTVRQHPPKSYGYNYQRNWKPG
jgi:hypothetical protein